MISEKIHETVNYIIKNPRSTRLSVTILGSQTVYMAIPEGVKTLIPNVYL